MGVRIPPLVQNKVNIMLKYFSEAFEELKSNVTWPAWAEVQKYTIKIVAILIEGDCMATFDDAKAKVEDAVICICLGPEVYLGGCRVLTCLLRSVNIGHDQ